MTHVAETLGLPGLSVLVVGLARSGAGVASLLRRHGFAVRGTDRKPAEALGETAARLVGEGVELALGAESEAALAGMDFVVVSPGVPDSNPVVRAALHRGLPLLSEIEVASRFLRGPILAVTGTNGKTTTATWLAHLLRLADVEVQLAGNVGFAISEVADTLTPKTHAVLEVSSFQLERIQRFRPLAASVLNVRPDHMDRYASLEEYTAAKARIFENQGEGDVGVLNALDPGARALEKSVRGDVAWFDRGGPVGLGAGLSGDWISLFRGGRPQRILPVAELALRGPHNLENALAAVAMTLPLSLAPDRLAEGLRHFPAIPHRLEPCGEWAGVTYVNDSKATNLDSMEKALLSFDRPVLLIAGGRDKGADWTTMTALVREKARLLLLIGEAAPRVRAANPGVPAVDCASLEEAIDEGHRRAAPGETVLLSPGCASYDMFKDFEDRGDRFRAAVAERIARGR